MKSIRAVQRVPTRQATFQGSCLFDGSCLDFSKIRGLSSGAPGGFKCRLLFWLSRWFVEIWKEKIVWLEKKLVGYLALSGEGVVLFLDGEGDVLFLKTAGRVCQLHGWSPSVKAPVERIQRMRSAYWTSESMERTLLRKMNKLIYWIIRTGMGLNKKINLIKIFFKHSSSKPDSTLCHRKESEIQLCPSKTSTLLSYAINSVPHLPPCQRICWIHRNLDDRVVFLSPGLSRWNIGKEGDGNLAALLDLLLGLTLIALTSLELLSVTLHYVI